MAEYQKYMVQYLGPDAMDEIIPPTLQAELDKAARGEPAKKEHVQVVRDEMVMGAFDGNKKTWQGNGVQELPRKSLGPVVMCSEYLSEKKGPMVLKGEVWENAPDELCMELRKAYQELNGSDEFAKHDDVRTRVLILPGKSREGYWEGQHVVEQWQRLARPVFELLHPGCVGVWQVRQQQRPQPVRPGRAGGDAPERQSRGPAATYAQGVVHSVRDGGDGGGGVRGVDEGGAEHGV